METKGEQITTEVVFNGDRTYEIKRRIEGYKGCLLYTSDAADDYSV